MRALKLSKASKLIFESAAIVCFDKSRTLLTDTVYLVPSRDCGAVVSTTFSPRTEAAVIAKFGEIL